MGSANLCRIRKVATASATWKRRGILGPVEGSAGPSAGSAGASAEGLATAVLGSTYYCLGRLRAKDLDQGTPYQGSREVKGNKNLLLPEDLQTPFSHRRSPD